MLENADANTTKMSIVHSRTHANNDTALSWYLLHHTCLSWRNEKFGQRLNRKVDLQISWDTPIYNVSLLLFQSGFWAQLSGVEPPTQFFHSLCAQQLRGKFSRFFNLAVAISDSLGKPPDAIETGWRNRVIDPPGQDFPPFRGWNSELGQVKSAHVFAVWWCDDNLDLHRILLTSQLHIHFTRYISPRNKNKTIGRERCRVSRVAHNPISTTNANPTWLQVCLQI